MSYSQSSFQRTSGEKSHWQPKGQKPGNEARELLALLVVGQKNGAGFYSQSLTSSHTKPTCIQKRQNPESFL